MSVCAVLGNLGSFAGNQDLLQSAGALQAVVDVLSNADVAKAARFAITAFSKDASKDMLIEIYAPDAIEPCVGNDFKDEASAVFA